MQTNTNIAAGIAAFSPKCSNANTVPNPAFCMLISIVSVRLRRLSIVKADPTAYPPNIP